MDRDCAHVHAILIRGETTVRSGVRTRFMFLAYTPHAQGTRYVPRKAVDVVNNLPSWAPNWARGNRVLQVGATVFDSLPSTEPRASRSYDRRGRQVGMTTQSQYSHSNANTELALRTQTQV